MELVQLHPRLHSRGHGHDLFDVPARDMYPLLGRSPMVLINFCFVLVTVGDILLILLLGTLLFSERVRRRNLSLINLLVVTIIASVPPALLYYGQEILNRRPPHALCFSQAILKHGTDPMFVIASLALVIEFLQGTGKMVLRFIQKHHYRVAVLVAMPYITFIIFATITAILGAVFPTRVRHKKSQVACTVNFPALTHSVEFFSVLAVLITLAIEIITFYRLRKSWKDVKPALPSTGERARSGGSSTFGYSHAMRIVGFTVLQLNFIILSGIDFYFTSVATHIIPIVYESLIPLGTFLIFGTTEDCLHAWMFWRRYPPTDQAIALPITPSIPVRRGSESYLLPTPVEAHPPLLPPKDHLHEIYRPGPEFDEERGMEGGTRNMSEIRGSVIQSRSRDRDSQGYKPIPTLDGIYDKYRSLILKPAPPPKSPKPDRGSPLASRYFDDGQMVEVKDNVTNTKEEVQSPSSTQALRFFELQSNHDRENLKSKGEEEVTVQSPSSTRAMRFFEPSCPQIEVKLPPEGFSISDWGL
ncbi:hypothetical protein QCA50_010240 [Cerrena zonata]|uniref:G-protein coupled receptors family 1 profile domain-containing protein n=1 Tax=Cerrena zonata TaxID=2478898 RepID=A0AAW0FZK1_9APHY